MHGFEASYLSLCFLQDLHQLFLYFTPAPLPPKRSCEKVMFSDVSICPTPLHCTRPHLIYSSPFPFLQGLKPPVQDPHPQTCSNLFNLDLTGPPWTCLNMFTMKHGLSKSRRLAFDRNAFLLQLRFHRVYD